MNVLLPRVIVAPLTSKGQPLGYRPEITLDGNRPGFFWTSYVAWTRFAWLGKWEKWISPCGIRFFWKCWPDSEISYWTKGGAGSKTT
jgi:hypothetical protein